MAVQTVLGGARMVEETGRHPASLKDDVTSPAGTTIAGLRAAERAGLRFFQLLFFQVFFSNFLKFSLKYFITFFKISE